MNSPADPSWQPFVIWLISLASIALVLIRPKRLPEALWSTIGASLLVLFGLIRPVQAGQAAAKGFDVYLFLIGMMTMAELARREGVFDWIAVHAVNAAKGSRRRLFTLIYGVGIVVTVLLSNDATAVVLTPAVQAAVKAAQAEPLPYLLICAFVANAASFVLPISNPANLVVYSGGLPPLNHWLLTFGLPALVSIAVTYFLLRFLSRKLLNGGMAVNLQSGDLSAAGKLTLSGIGLLAITLIVASVLGKDLGAPACAAGFIVTAGVWLRDRHVAADIVREISWSVILLVAGLFVIVEGMNQAGALPAAVSALRRLSEWNTAGGALTAAFGIAFISNLMNNLPSGLIAGSAVHLAHITGPLRGSVLIGVDLGPNLSVTGSLATILWLIAIRREGQQVGFWKFLKWGAIVMPPALAFSVLALLIGSN
jgi:arsenical pump membrane protein